MEKSDRNPLPPPAPPADGMTWAHLAHHMRLHGSNFVPPPHLRGLPLEYVERKAREEGRAEREAKEARESMERIENAPQSIERALLDGPRPSRQAERPQRGWRQRVRFLNHLRRCRTYREAAARIGVDESTVRRWRRKFPAFDRRCDEVVAERHRENCDDLRLRAGEPRTRPYFFRGKRIGEHVVHDDRALMHLIDLDEAARRRVEDRAERREQREHEYRMRQLEIEARRGKQRQDTISELPASAAHSESLATEESRPAINDLASVPADIAAPRVAEVVSSDSSPTRSVGEVPPQGAEGARGSGATLMTPSGPAGHLPR